MTIFRGLVYLSAGDTGRGLDALDRAKDLEPDAFTHLAGFLAHALRGEADAARAILGPEVTPGLWQDFQYAEWIAQGFVLLNDIAEATRWLAQAANLGSGIHDALTRHSAVWRPWLNHPALAPIFESFKQNVERYARIPVAPRALALGEVLRNMPLSKHDQM